MLKYERIVKRLSIADKIGILTDITALDDENISRLGVPKLNVLYLRHMMRGRTPLPAALAHSWDRELIRDVAGSISNDVDSTKAALVITPGAKVKLSPYRNDLSEDPYLAAELSAEFASGVRESGLATAMSGYYLTDTEADLMDKKPSERVINEFIVNTYASAMKRSEAEAVMTDMRTLSGTYSAVNSGIRDTVLKDKRFGSSTFAICERVEADDTVAFIVGGGICFNGSAVALETALNKYHKLKKSCDVGDLTVGDVEAEIAAGRAISPEIIDEAADRLIDLAFASQKNVQYSVDDVDGIFYTLPDDETKQERKERLKREKIADRDRKRKARIIARKIRRGEYVEEESEAEEEEVFEPIVTAEDKLLRRAAYESVVLLRNVNNIAPIKNRPTVALIGGIGDSYSDGVGTLFERCETLLREAGVPNVIKSRGYDMDAERTAKDSMITEAITAAGRSGIVLLFLGHGEKRGKDIPNTNKLSLPANQLLLAEKLSRFGARVIAVLESGYGMDVRFTDRFAGAVMAPLGCPYDAEALIDILLGRVNPSGRLAYTLYSSFDSYSHKHAVYRDKWNVKSGPFVGYRYYDTANLKVGYPFGFGLSYVDAVYSDIKVTKESVTFTVTNPSKKISLREIAQVYVGAQRSNVIRPTKELCGFESIHLAPEESKTVTVKFETPKVYDVARGKMTDESCTYNVYVGPSSVDERLVGSYYGGSHAVTPDKQDPVDYILSQTNIFIDNYTLEAKYRIMKRSAKNIISGIISILLAISLGIYNSLESAGTFISIMSAVLAFAGIIFFALEVRERNKGYKEERVIIDQANKDHFRDAEVLPEFSAKRMFHDEFDVVDDSDLARESILRDDGSEDESLKYIDKELDFAKASRELRSFASDRGISLGDIEAEKIFASFAASRLVVFKDMRSDVFRSLVAVLSEYFETNPYIDTVDDTYVDEQSALFGKSGENKRAKRNLAYAIEAARNVKHNVHIAALDNVKCENVLAYFKPYAKYAKNPFGYTAISARNEWEKESTYYIPQNMWFAINLAEGEDYDAIPDYIAETASINVISPAKCKATGAHTVISKFRYYQFDYLSDRSANSFGIFEESWKKIDKLAAYVGGYCDFRIENKLCLSLERYATALMASGVEAPIAFDAALASKLLPVIIVALEDKIPEEDRGLEETLDNIFGGDVLDECRALMKDLLDERNDRKSKRTDVSGASRMDSDEYDDPEIVEEINYTEEVVDDVADDVVDDEE